MADPTLIPLSAKLSDMALNRYIESFLDSERMSFQTYLMLEKLRRNKGYRSSGYMLWDYLESKPKRRPYIISESTLKSYTHRLSDILVYWDCTYVDPNSPFSNINRICAAHFHEITANLDHCPPTLYMFDRDFQWTLIRSDEPLNELGWNCLQVGEIGLPRVRRPTTGLDPVLQPPNLIPLQRNRLEQL
jgi:hypothetical protein